jgi:hypothetical protein
MEEDGRWKTPEEHPAAKTPREKPQSIHSNSKLQDDTKLHISTNQISHPENADEKIGFRRKVVAVAVVVGGTAR